MFRTAKFPPTIFSFIWVCTFHSGENLVRRTIEGNGFFLFVDKLWCGLTIRAYRRTSVRGTREEKFSISMGFAVLAFDSLNSMWAAALKCQWFIIAVLIFSFFFIGTWINYNKIIIIILRYTYLQLVLETYHWQQLLHTLQCTLRIPEKST